MKTKFFSILFILVLTVSACGGGSQFQQNRAKWERQNINHYRYTLVISCFCLFAGAEVTYEVQNGQVVNESIQPHPDRQINPAEISQYYQPYNTLEKVFEYVEEAINDADQTTIEYDPTYGFPTNVSVDWDQQAADEEMYFTIINFEPVS